MNIKGEKEEELVDLHLFTIKLHNMLFSFNFVKKTKKF